MTVKICSGVNQKSTNINYVLYLQCTTEKKCSGMQCKSLFIMLCLLGNGILHISMS